MATLGGLVVAVLFLAAQFSYARHLDRILPKRKKLPLWGKFGVCMEKRATALYTYPWWSVMMAVALLTVTVTHDLDDRQVRSAGDMIGGFAFVMAVWALLNALNVWRLRRWFRKGEPKVGR